MASDQGRKAPPGGRDDRLAAALRENLKRRKAQARQRGESKPDAEPPPGRTGKDR